MNFLNPAVLFALGAAALPVLIHLLSRRRAKEVAFPSIEFLERMKTDRMRRLRLKQILLILLRTLIIIMVVLAFARPAVNSAFQKNARTSAVIIIDSSASMEYVHNGEVLFDAALRRAGEILDILGKDDMAAVILSTDVPALLGPGMTADKKELADALSKVKNSLTVSNATLSFSMAVDMLSSTADPNREIFYITDGAVNALPDSLPAVKSPLRIYTVLAGPEKRRGAVIEYMELQDRLLTAEKPVTFRVRGRLSPEEVNMNVEFFVNGERKGRSLAERRSGESVETAFKYTPETPGWYSVFVSVNDGRFEPGETKRFVMRVPRRVRVVLAAGTPEDIYFLNKALDPDPERSMFLIKKVTGAELTLSDISQADVVVLAGIESLPASLYRSLVTAVAERGIGLVVFPPRNMDESLYADGIFRDIFPVESQKRVAIDGKSGNFAVIEWFDTNHPVLRGVSREGKFQKPGVTSYIRMRPAGRITVLARFNDGSMAVGDAVCGNGRVVVFAVDSSLGDSELPLTGIFVPLFIRTVQYLSGTDISGGSYETGEIIDEYIGDVPENISIYIRPDEGPSRSVEIIHSENGARVKGEKAVKPGFYSVRAGENERSRFCVDIPRSELVFKRAGNAQSDEAFKGIRWKAVESTDNLTETVVKDRYGRELFGLFIVLALMLIAVEMVVSRKV